MFQWNEAVYGVGRGLRGGSWAENSSFVASFDRVYIGPVDESSDSAGFRVASVP